MFSIIVAVLFVIKIYSNSVHVYQRTIQYLSILSQDLLNKSELNKNKKTIHISVLKTFGSVTR